MTTEDIGEGISPDTGYKYGSVAHSKAKAIQSHAECMSIEGLVSKIEELEEKGNDFLNISSSALYDIRFECKIYKNYLHKIRKEYEAPNQFFALYLHKGEKALIYIGKFSTIQDAEYAAINEFYLRPIELLSRHELEGMFDHFKGITKSLDIMAK